MKTTASVRTEFGKAAPLLLGFEEALANSIARVCSHQAKPVWSSGGNLTSSVYDAHTAPAL